MPLSDINASPEVLPDFFQSELDHHSGVTQKPIRLRYYGPVNFDGPGSPVRIWHLLNDGDIGDYLEVEATSKFTASIETDGTALGARTLKIVGNDDTYFYPGRYRIDVVMDVEDSNRLYSDIHGKPTVRERMYDAPYWFRVLVDCNGNLQADSQDIFEDPELDENDDGLIDDCDRYGGCPVDFNEDGFVNGDDADLFSLYFYYDIEWADWNGDTFVNADDMDQFSIAFYEGCGS